MYKVVYYSCGAPFAPTPVVGRLRKLRRLVAAMSHPGLVCAVVPC